ncbi:MAG: SbcC/MukB-like Walker B domain-containing protein [Myxococcota bacterium]
MPTPLLDFATSDRQAGFRLHRLEALNWGTFDEKVWIIAPRGDNALLTGDIGSGKSTLVDALTTLLVPHQRIVYNKAAGAESKERDLYSYIRGEYKSAKDEATLGAKAVALRGDDSYTVLLAHFYSAGFDQHVTLAQVFWLKDNQRNPERFFVVAERDLAIALHFGDFGDNPLELKKRLRKTSGVAVFDSFKEYGGRFRQIFGIQNEQALELFYQTVSMKSVGNLTDFVRDHMLGRGDVEQRLEELRRHFDNLHRAHEAVLKAKRQIERLGPLVADGTRHAELLAAIETLAGDRDALSSYFARLASELLTVRITDDERQHERLGARLEAAVRDEERLRGEEATLRADIEAQGGRRLRELEQEVGRLESERNRRSHAAEAYHARATAVELPAPAPTSDEAFETNRSHLEAELAHAQDAAAAQQAERDQVTVAFSRARDEHGVLEREITSLAARRSNIPSQILALRDQMAAVLEVDVDELPFAGELLQVHDSERDWEGAIERLLHGFGLSLLVSESLYERVSRYVDDTHLRERLVYFRAVEPDHAHASRTPRPDTVAHKLVIKSDSGFYGWLERELVQRFDYVCCEDLDAFRREPQALSRRGQIKHRGNRHEKDDRRRVDDRAHFVLGWSNAEKLATLKAQLLLHERTLQEQGTRLAGLDAAGTALQKRRDLLRDLDAVTSYESIAWQPLAAEIERLHAERRAVESSSDVLALLHDRLKTTLTALGENRTRHDTLLSERSKLEASLELDRSALTEAQTLGAALTDGARLTRLDALRREVLGEAALAYRSLDKARTQVREALQARLDGEHKRAQRLGERVLTAMLEYKHDYPAETAEVDSALAAVPSYAGMLSTLETEDLPRHEARFKQQLNEGTINSVALFQSQLEQERRAIEQKIAAINRSLRGIEYSPGTYIALHPDPTQDADVRQFREDLRQCLSHGLADDALYNEGKFLQIKALIERFSGREGLVDLDARWTRKVTDVRHWFLFSASERWREGDVEREFYSDTSGKSGGQKEKLAYTILASALAYQFGLEWDAIESRSFRFVVIDEAFAKGSDESTRYALDLFDKLHLQLLIATPLQKIHVIEDYIAAVHFVHNDDGHSSKVRNLTLAEYRAEKERRTTTVISAPSTQLDA